MIDKIDCFARYETLNGQANCSALVNKKCNNCKFYRNDLNRQDIESDIKTYASSKSTRKKEYI